MLELLSWYRAHSKSQRRSGKPSRRRRLVLEGLESRDLLSAVPIGPKAVLLAPPDIAPALVAASLPAQNTLAAPGVVTNVNPTPGSPSSETALAAAVSVKPRAGTYRATYSGFIRGTITFTVDAKGLVKVIGGGTGSGKIVAPGRVQSLKITVKVQGFTIPVTLNGNFTTNTSASGKWTAFGRTGNWNATRIR